MADFVGSANLIRGKLRPDLANGNLVVLEADGGLLVHGVAHGRGPTESSCLSVRTVHLSLSSQPGDRNFNVWPVTVRHSVFLGDMRQIHVGWGSSELIIRQTGMQTWSEGQSAYLSADPQHCVLLERA